MTPGDILDVLRDGNLELDGRLVLASNATFVGTVSLDGVEVGCVYKPARGERPLWDFPDGTLAAREVAAYELSVASGWDIVPPTVLRDGPFGAGMCQQWVDTDASRELVDIMPAEAVPAGWLAVLEAEDGAGRPVALAHADDPALARMAMFDAIVNNADRKGGHVLPTPDGEARGVDHGVTFHREDKLRTVLWGWAGEGIPPQLAADLRRLVAAVTTGDLGARLSRLLAGYEVQALRTRLENRLRTGSFPLPPPGWPAIPWPPL